MGPDNVPGYDKVQTLAYALIRLQDPSRVAALSGDEVDRLVECWSTLDENDKKKITYSARHQDKLIKGRFKASKKIVAPGVESTRR